MCGMRPSYPWASAPSAAARGELMTEDDIPQFGTGMPGLAYSDRPSAYGVAVNAAARVLVCRRTRGRLLLPGGGVERGESALDALRREVAEETGCRVVAASELCRARQFHSHRLAKPPVNKLCHFFAMEVEHDPAIPTERDHQAVWLSAHELAATLTFESHRYALQRYFERHRI